MSNVYLERLRAISGKPVVQGPTKPTKGASVGFVGAATTGIPENEAANDARDLDAELAVLLRQRGGFPGIDWAGLGLTDATSVRVEQEQERPVDNCPIRVNG